MDALLEPFQTGIGARALAEVLLLGLACGPLGAWVLLHRQSFAAESISHGMLPGLVLAAIAGLPLVLGALGGVVAAALAIGLAGRDERLGPDAGVAVAVTALFGAGSLLALSPEAPPRLQELLFGDLLGVTGRDVAVAGALCAAVVIALAAGHRRLALTAFDRTSAPSLGARPARVETALLVLLAVTTAAAVQALGNLLVVALVLAPGAAALVLGRRLPAVLALSAAFAVAAGVIGLELSHHLRIATGAAIALSAVALFVAGVTASAVRGTSAR